MAEAAASHRFAPDPLGGVVENSEQLDLTRSCRVVLSAPCHRLSVSCCSLSGDGTKTSQRHKKSKAVSHGVLDVREVHLAGTAARGAPCNANCLTR